MKMEIQGLHYDTKKPIRIEIEEGIIKGVEEIEETRTEECYIAPGFVDLQINGFKGYDLNTIPFEESLISAMTHHLYKEGVTSYFPTIITNSDEAIKKGVRTIAKACEDDSLLNKSIPGIHLEGPFISKEDGPRGAHHKKYVKAPSWELFQRWQEAAEGNIKIITLSPEWKEAPKFIEKCVENDVVVSIGHTAATPTQIQEAVKAGATLSTHLGNGAHLMLPRHPNYLWEQLAEDKLWTCLIADGFHLPDSFLKVAIKVKGEKAIIVSDAVYLGGLKPGLYETHIGGKVQLTNEGKLHLADEPDLLAGSVQTIREGVENLIRKKVVPEIVAFHMASIHPSTFMNLPMAHGLVQGAPADLIIYRKKKDHLSVEKTFKAGKLVYQNST